MPAPFNIQILEPNEYIQRKNILPVSSHAMFEASTSRFHPEGLFSEVIFGQVGSSERLIRRGFFDLKTRIISPHIYKQIMTLKSFYRDIAAGKEYAVFDPQLKDLVRVTRDDPEGRTGYAFFIETLPKIEFKETESTKRSDKIAILKKYADRIFMTRFIILPAGVRDVREENGRIAPEEINKLYLGLLSLTQAMPEQETNDPVFDSIRYQIQTKVQQIYTYIADLFDGKGGFGQSKYAARNVVYSSRNVITAATVSRVSEPESPNAFSANEVLVPLFQGMKGATPLIINKLKTVFFEQIFGSQSMSIPAINPTTLKLEYKEIDSAEMKKFTTSEGINSFITGFRNSNMHFSPVTVRVKNGEGKKGFSNYFLYLVYDDGKNVYPFRNIDDFFQFYGNKDRYSISEVDNLGYVDHLNPSDFMILGSTALRVFGMVNYNQDIDILVSEEIMDTIRKDPEFEKQSNNVYRRKDGKVDVYNDLILKEAKTSFKEYKHQYSIQIDKFFFETPAHLLEVYQTSNRMKDKGKIEFLKTIVVDTSCIRPMTHVEMCYMASFAALRDKYATATRYPVLNLEGIAPFKIHLVSTTPSRVVTLRRLQEQGSADIVLPEYPRLDSTVKTSLSVHPSTLDKYNGDYDGDTLGLNILMSDEATEEVRNYMDKPISLVDANGKLVYGLDSCRVTKYQMFLTSWHPLK